MAEGRFSYVGLAWRDCVPTITTQRLILRLYTEDEAETIVESGAYSGALLTMSAVFLSSVYLWPVFDVVGFEVLFLPKRLNPL